MSETLTEQEKELIMAMMDFISELPTSYEPIQRLVDFDEEEFFEIKSSLRTKIKNK